MPKSTSRSGGQVVPPTLMDNNNNNNQLDQQSDETDTATNSSGDGQTSTNNKSKRIVKTPYTKRACLTCHKAKVKCSHERPCQRCTTKGIECVDYVPIQQQQQQQQQQLTNQIVSLNNNDNMALMPNQFCPMILLP